LGSYPSVIGRANFESSSPNKSLNPTSLSSILFDSDHLMVTCRKFLPLVQKST
jgi:hypothetical protein